MRTIQVSIVGCLMGVAALAASNSPVTFNKDVLPVLQKNCQECHRPGEVTPMSLINYSDARPWAKAIKAAVLAKKMPPWFADPKYGHFANERTLSEAEVNTLAAWADGGAVEGDAKDRPAPVTFPEGWQIKPDLIVEMPKPFAIPAKGTVNYKWIVVKTNFPQDLWVEAAEMRPGNSKVLHHGKVWVRPPGSHWMENAVPGEAYELETQANVMGRNQMAEGNDILGKFNPGLGAQDFKIDGAAKFVPKGSDLVFEMHYTASGQETSDVSKIGLVLAKNPPQRRYFLATGPSANNLIISPGDSNAEVVSEVTVGLDNVKLVYAQPHMHLRGKDMQLRAVYPNGETEIFLDSKWNFEWQLGYDFTEPVALPKGTRLIAISHFDNSANNPFNPDPQKEVWWGLQNWEEMSNCFVGLTIDLKDNPDRLFRRTGPSLLRPVTGVSGPTLTALR
ncbi:MAG TPA: cytochrome c [Bryobacteraceae bacterium]|nr:cytochrome c [Bryobacteraceae bacterium]